MFCFISKVYDFKVTLWMFRYTVGRFFTHLLSLNIPLMQAQRISASRHPWHMRFLFFFPYFPQVLPTSLQCDCIFPQFPPPPTIVVKLLSFPTGNQITLYPPAPAIGDGNLNAVAPPACRTFSLVASSATNVSFVRCCFTNWDTLCLQCISYILSGHGCVFLHVDVWTPSGLVFLLL